LFDSQAKSHFKLGWCQNKKLPFLGSLDFFVGFKELLVGKDLIWSNCPSHHAIDIH